MPATKPQIKSDHGGRKNQMISHFLFLRMTASLTWYFRNSFKRCHQRHLPFFV